MFRKLRRQLIGTTMAITAVVVLVSFSILYATAAASFHRTIAPPPSGPGAMRFERLDDETRKLFETQRTEFANRSLAELRFMLIGASIVILLAVYLLSRYIAERAVRAIEYTYEAQRRFIADASHELKTPITAIGISTEAAIEDSLHPSKWLHNIKSETERMGQLVGNLLVLARLDDTAQHPPRQLVDIAALLDETIDTFEPAGAHKAITMRKQYRTPIKATTNRELLQQLLVILIDNAIKYTKLNGTITLTIDTPSPKTTYIRISNTHEYIPPEILEKFFDRFYQADASHHSQGHGLGLAIAKTIALQLGVALSATSREGSLTFEVEIPQLIK